MADFAAQVSAWVAKATARAEAVQRDAAQELVKEVLTPVKEGGHMPVLTGWLRSSLRGSTETMPGIDPNSNPPADAAPGTFSPDFGQIGLAILDWKIGETLNLGFTASYAAVQEAKQQFVGAAAQRWPNIVQASVSKLQDALSRPSS